MLAHLEERPLIRNWSELGLISTVICLIICLMFDTGQTIIFSNEGGDDKLPFGNLVILFSSHKHRLKQCDLLAA